MQNKSRYLPQPFPFLSGFKYFHIHFLFFEYKCWIIRIINYQFPPLSDHVDIWERETNTVSTNGEDYLLI
jgi:hypothetical protein